MLWVLSYIFSYFTILLGLILITWLLNFTANEKSGLGIGFFSSVLIVVPLVAIPVSLVVRMYFKRHSNGKQFTGVKALLILLTIGMLFSGLLFFFLYPSILQSGEVLR